MHMTKSIVGWQESTPFLWQLLSDSPQDQFFLCVIVLLKKNKSAVCRLPQSKKYCIVCKPYLAVWRPGWELRTQLDHL